MNLLNKTRFYLIGAIEAANDQGVSWRKEIQEKLKDVGIKWFDPCEKQFVKDVQEVGSHQLALKELRARGEYNELAIRMREIRIYDLSMVDRADAIIFYYDSNVQTCGSWEECFHANSLKRPIFFIAKNGLNTIPLWMYGVLPANYFYESLDDVVEMIKRLDSREKTMDSDRWRLFRPEFR